MTPLTGQLCAAAPPGLGSLDDVQAARLQEVTRALIMERADQAAAEYDRFAAVRKREITLPRRRLAARLDGRVILVTGGTGCVGSALIRELGEFRPAAVISVSRGITREWPRYPHAQYRDCDITDPAQVTATVTQVRPDVVFHVAGQRDPGLAETEVHRTVMTNIFGTRNLVDAAAPGTRVVFAGTGKALRPFSPDIYTASKRAAERIAWDASAVRFTHIADNSIIIGRLRDWAAGQAGGVIRLHSPDASFYVQSATEAAQLLLLAALDSRLVRVIRDLDWPVSLLDLSLGLLARAGSQAPVYVSGYGRGYEETPFPGLYDPATAGDVSPLVNAFEAAALLPPDHPETDASPSARCPLLPPVSREITRLERACARTQDPEVIRAALHGLSWALLDDTLAAVPGPVLARMAALAGQHTLNGDYARVLARMREHLTGRAGALTWDADPPRPGHATGATPRQG